MHLQIVVHPMSQPRYIAYYRVSTAAQGRSGLGLEAQQAAVKAFLQGRDHDRAGQFITVESGRNSERPTRRNTGPDSRPKAILVIANR